MQWLFMTLNISNIPANGVQWYIDMINVHHYIHIILYYDMPMKCKFAITTIIEHEIHVNDFTDNNFW